MKKGLLLLVLVGISLGVFAQQYPSEWMKYTAGGYLSDIQSDRNDRNQSGTEFISHLLNAARLNLAKQVQMRIRDFAELKKNSINGQTVVSYSSETQFSTDVDFKLIETKSHYDPEKKEGYAIAYVDKHAACQYYQNEIALFLGKADNSLTIARNYIGSGFKNRAKTELEAILSGFKTTDEAFFLLGIFGLSQRESEELLMQRNEREQIVKQILADLQCSTSIYLDCVADIFGIKYAALEHELKGKLSAEGCNFIVDPTQADWIIRVNVNAREYNHLTMNSRLLYFAYVDADISIDKVITSQRVCEDRTSLKGGHTHNYTEAARAACRDLSNQLNKIILKNIQR